MKKYRVQLVILNNLGIIKETHLSKIMKIFIKAQNTGKFEWKKHQGGWLEGYTDTNISL